VDWQAVPGAAFWLGPEVATLPALTAATLHATAQGEAVIAHRNAGKGALK
jgi:hypothetical protein